MTTVLGPAKLLRIDPEDRQCRNWVRPVAIKGRGVFASTRYESGDVVERAPVVVLPREAGGWPVLEDYVFEWSRGRYAIALGDGSLYNHARSPNLEYRFAHARREIVFVARRRVGVGEELTIHYANTPGRPLSKRWSFGR